MSRMTRKDVSTLQMVMRLANRWRDMELGRWSGTDGMGGLHPKLVQSKLDWLSRRGVTDEWGYDSIQRPEKWRIDEGEKAEILERLDQAGFMFGDDELVLTDADRAEQELQKAANEKSRRMMLAQPGVIGQLLRRAEAVQDAYARDLEQYILTGKTESR